MENQKIIRYSGVGCNRTHYHTETEFLEIMRKGVAEKRWIMYEINYSHGWFWDYFFGKSTMQWIDRCQLEYKHFDLPKDFEIFTLDDWLDYSGAIEE